MTIRMNELGHGQQGTVLDVRVPGSLRQRLLDLGLVPGTAIERVMVSPAGDPICYRVRGAMIALRRCDANDVLLTV